MKIGDIDADFRGDNALRSGIRFKLAIIGEAASRVPADFRERYPEVE